MKNENADAAPEAPLFHGAIKSNEGRVSRMTSGSQPAPSFNLVFKLAEIQAAHGLGRRWIELVSCG
jgi:hypothetical protein